MKGLIGWEKPGTQRKVTEGIGNDEQGANRKLGMLVLSVFS